MLMSALFFCVQQKKESESKERVEKNSAQKDTANLSGLQRKFFVRFSYMFAFSLFFSEKTRKEEREKR
jgi:hypothetical protein